jgi:hypothetical protein
MCCRRHHLARPPDPGNNCPHYEVRGGEMDGYIILDRHPHCYGTRARVAKLGQRRQVEGLVSKEFLGSNPIPRMSGGFFSCFFSSGTPGFFHLYFYFLIRREPG